ncbi:hypothetical protein Tco_1209923 [Tanacetum coccineum]
MSEYRMCAGLEHHSRALEAILFGNSHYVKLQCHELRANWDHKPRVNYRAEHPEELVPAEDEAPTPLLPPSFLSPLLETDARRHEWQRQAADDLAVQYIMRTQALEAGARVDTLDGHMVAVPRTLF